MITDKLKSDLQKFAHSLGYLTVLTGAGISAESGIPTFRGRDGYWTVGSKEYHPQEMATLHMFSQQPEEVWAWYLYRRGVCRQAEPNPGHMAIVDMESLFGDKFILITQNVDGLHLRAGNSLERTYQIHGNVDYMRCFYRACTSDIYSIPETMPAKPKGESLTDTNRKLLACPKCGHLTRPHVLWFDEYYNEEYYHYDSSTKVACRTDLLIIVGTSGITSLPNQVAHLAAQCDSLIIDVNINSNPFSEFALHAGGYFIQQTSGVILPQIVNILEKGEFK
ncbi:MAG: RNA polymerase subunit sigma [Anaerolineaceae bacterium 4572_78]|nr:MAG: RNA polymerase subunit sigma [Anaerolineaceae bacterium 4572_78]